MNRNPTVAISWKNKTNATPIDDLRSWQTELAFDTGYYPEEIEFGMDVAGAVMECENKYGLDLISELPDMLFGVRQQLILGNDPSDGKVILRIGSQKDKFIEATVF